MDVTEYMTYDATGLAELVASKQVKPSELLAAARQRADEVNGRLNAIVVRTDDLANSIVDDADLSGPFAGVPFLVKDLMQEVAGYPTSYGSRALRGDVATEHAAVVQRWLDAGLVIFGKTNTPEFGAKGVTEPEYWGPARNPWRLGHTPGGSSGGSGAAVAAGVVPAAGANDGGGSIRIPAACNGLVGLKPSRGLAPYGPQTGESMIGMAVQGVVARTVRDNAGLLDAIVGPHPYAGYQAPVPQRPFAEAVKDAPGRLRVGFSARSAITADPDPEAVAAMHEAAALLAELGHEVEEVTPPYDDEALARDFLTIWFANLAAEVELTKARTGATSRDFEADTLAIAEIGRAAGVVAAQQALGNVHGYVRSLVDFQQSYDLFLTPTLAKRPLRVGELTTAPLLQRLSRVVSKAKGGRVLAKTGILDELVSQNLGWVPYTQLANLTGRPAINVPLHWTPEGLPLGVQLVGRLGEDALLLQVAAQLEQARPWAHRHPAPLAR